MGEGEYARELELNDLARRGRMPDGTRAPSPTVAKPFLKWVGGKRQLVPELMKALPAKWKHYYEPFIGGGALFFALRAQGWRGRADLGDMNALLVQAYMGVRNDVEAVISALGGMRYDKREFLERRADMPIDHSDEIDVAAWSIYMNRCGFNGLWRVNKKGQFNVPFGRYDNPTICDAPNLRACSRALIGATFRMGDFEKTVRGAERGDLVYLDPPYVPVSASADFTAYTANGFGLEDQQRLAECARRLKRLGVHVVLSNADVPLVRKLYAGLDIRRVEARRNVNSKVGGRGPVGEVIIT